jgi:anti-anti-sigma factor
MGKDVSDYDILHPLSGTFREGKQMSDVDALNSTDTALSVLMVGFTSAGSSCTLTLIGELNGTSIPALEAQIDQIGGSDCQNVVLDVSGLVAIDSVGVRVLTGLNHYGRGLGAHLTVIGASGQVAEALAATSLDLVDLVRTRVPRCRPFVQSTVLFTKGIPL